MIPRRLRDGITAEAGAVTRNPAIAAAFLATG
jgi:hypothetical protein